MLFLLIGSVSALDTSGIAENSIDSQIDNDVLNTPSNSQLDNDNLSAPNDDDDLLSGESSESILSDDSDGDEPADENVSFSPVTKTNYIINQYFVVKLLDKNGVGIFNKTVYFTINGNTTAVQTDNDGVVKFLITIKKGNYIISYSFNETGYTPIKTNKKILVLSKPVSVITGFNRTIYAGLYYTYTVALKADGIPLPGRVVKFVFKKKVYTRKTNSKGYATLKIYVTRGNYAIGYYYYGEDNIRSSKGLSKVSAVYIKNPYKTRYRTVVIDADGGFSKFFLRDIANKLRKCGWRVIVKGIGPGQHSKNYKLVKNAVYMPFYNGLCAGTIYEMPLKYYGGVIKRNKAVLTPAWYTKDWVSDRMKQYRNDITKIKFLKRAWDDNFMPSRFKGLSYPANYMTKNNIKYCVGDTTYRIVEQFVRGGWVAYHK